MPVAGEARVAREDALATGRTGLGDKQVKVRRDLRLEVSSSLCQ